MITTSKKLRIDYAPLDITVDMQLGSSSSGLTQTYNVAKGEYEPDRTNAFFWTILIPIVRVSAKDGSWPKDLAMANTRLTNVVWLLDGQDIKTSSLAHSIDTSGYYLGRLLIKENIPAGSSHTLQFTAALKDPRKNVTIPIVSELMYLSCTTKAEDILSISVTRKHFSYDVMHDKLAEYDYKVCRGIIQGSNVERNMCLNGNEYIARFPFIVKYGRQDVTAEIRLTLARYNEESASWQDLISDSPDFPEISNFMASSRGYVNIDCRLIDKMTRYRLTVVRETPERTYSDSDEFSVRPSPSRYDLQIRNDSNLNINRRIRYDDVTVTSDGQKKDYPAAHLNIEWGTDRFEKTMNCGARGIIDTWREGDDVYALEEESELLGVRVSHEPKGAYSILTNGEDTDQYYMYSDGSLLIID